MSKKIDERLPREIGEGALPNHAAVKSPWEKLVSYHDAAHYAQRYSSVLGAAVMQAFRILVPDYVERSKALCTNAYNRLHFINCIPGVAAMQTDELNVHPFCAGNFPGGLVGDAGDEKLLMCGRVNDFGTYRVEKELDICYWDIIGSELCRSTTQSLQACADVQADLRRKGPHLEYHMVEAKGCGDRHCRIVAESRDKYPMPDHEQWECFGPVATADQIKFTKEEDTVSESMMFREECNYTFVNGTTTEDDSTSAYPMVAMSNGSSYILPTIDDLIREGRLDEKTVDHVLWCVCEAAGKAAFGEFYAKEGLRNWLGVPGDIDDGRVMGARLEMFLQCMRYSYEIEAFNKDEVIYIIDRKELANNMPKLVNAYLAYWYGETKTLVNAQWCLWEEPGSTADDKLRIKIAKKIDKFC
ncbi:MAG: hypothetical protein Q4D16_14060 [Eubacteriales bacterium]|nr:hypothetical protein [Eubacteriales bacterium]